MIKANYISTSEFADFHPELDLSTYTDATISGMISRASAYADNFLRYSLSVESIQNELNNAIVSSDGNLMVYTRKQPIVSVQQIQIKLGSVWSTLQLTDGAGRDRVNISPQGDYALMPYQQLASTGTIVMRNFYDLRGRDVFLNINYTAGYGVIPDDIKDAVGLLTKDIFIRQANPMGVISATQGGISMTFKARGANANAKSDIVLQAEAILSSYKRVIAP